MKQALHTTASSGIYRRRTLGALCYGYNDATNPRALRSDHEHALQGRRARRILEALHAEWAYLRDWREDDNGRLWPQISDLDVRGR